MRVIRRFLIVFSAAAVLALTILDILKHHLGVDTQLLLANLASSAGSYSESVLNALSGLIGFWGGLLNVIPGDRSFSHVLVMLSLIGGLITILVENRISRISFDEDEKEYPNLPGSEYERELKERVKRAQQRR